MDNSGTVFFRVAARDIHYINRIFEGYEYLGVVSTVNKKEGILAVRATSDTAATVREVLAGLPVALEILEGYET